MADPKLPIQVLADALAHKYPAASLEIRRPAGQGKIWWIDFVAGPNQAEIEWHPIRGFGLTVNSESVYGAQSDEGFSSSENVLSRMVQLLDSGGHTEESSELFVRALREGRKLTQTQLAELLDVKQASISRLENRSDFHLSTLRNIVSRLGGNLELRAKFPDGSVHILRYDEEINAKKRRPSLKAAIKRKSPSKTQASSANKTIKSKLHASVKQKD